MVAGVDSKSQLLQLLLHLFSLLNDSAESLNDRIGPLFGLNSAEGYQLYPGLVQRRFKRLAWFSNSSTRKACCRRSLKVW